MPQQQHRLAEATGTIAASFPQTCVRCQLLLLRLAVDDRHELCGLAAKQGAIVPVDLSEDRRLATCGAPYDEKPTSIVEMLENNRDARFFLSNVNHCRNS